MCGVVAVYNVKHAAVNLRIMLHALQNRGRDGCGILTTNVTEEAISYRVHRFLGTVADNFSPDVLNELKGWQGIGHTRYATAKNSDGILNVQPLVFDNVDGVPFAIAHNGNFTNMRELQEGVLQGTPFSTASDTERFFRLILREHRVHPLLKSIGRALSKMQGSCSAVMNVPGRVIAIRDASGNRPLFWGKKANGYAVASEPCALDAIDVLEWHEVPPGTIMSFSADGVEEEKLPEAPLRMCVFELVYFAFPTSIIHGVSVSQIRYELGKQLAQAYPTETDLVIGIPDSAIEMANGYAAGLGARSADNGIVMRRHDTGRTFILRSQKMRKKAVSDKFAFATHCIEGRTITLVDDSLVRGTTSAGITKALFKRGAKEVHWRIPSPMIIDSCQYGIATADKSLLLAANNSNEEMCGILKADSLEFFDLPGFQAVLAQHGLPVENGCFTCMNGIPWHRAA